MKCIGKARSRRWGYDGWALQVAGANKPLHWTTSTTRREVREIKRDLLADGFPIRSDLGIIKVKVKITVEAA